MFCSSLRSLALPRRQTAKMLSIISDSMALYFSEKSISERFYSFVRKRPVSSVKVSRSIRADAAFVPV
jgi:hypothetical protein